MALKTSNSYAMKEATNSTLSKEEKQLEMIKRVNFNDFQGLSVEQILVKFLKSEENYVEIALRRIVDFIKRVRSKRIPELTEEILSKVFLNIEAIYDFNVQFLADLKDYTASGRLIEELGRHVVRLGPYFKLYGIYINGQEEAIYAYRQLATESPKFYNLIIDNLEVTGYKLSSLLEVPTLRLPQYLIYLGALAFRLKGSEYAEAIQDINDAINQLKITVDTIAAQLRDRNAREAVVKIQIQVFKNSVALVDPARYLIRKDRLILVANEKSIFRSNREKILAALFNDMLMLVTLNGSVKKILRIRNLSLSEQFNSIDKDIRFGFRLSNDKTIYLFECGSEGTMRSWMEDLKDAIQTQQESLIGVSISDEYFEKMIMKKAPQISLIDAKQVQREIALKKSEDPERAKMLSEKEIRMEEQARLGSSTASDYAQPSQPPPSRRSNASSSGTLSRRSAPGPPGPPPAAAPSVSMTMSYDYQEDDSYSVAESYVAPAPVPSRATRSVAAPRRAAQPSYQSDDYYSESGYEAKAPVRRTPAPAAGSVRMSRTPAAPAAAAPPKMSYAPKPSAPKAPAPPASYQYYEQPEDDQGYGNQPYDQGYGNQSYDQGSGNQGYGNQGYDQSGYDQGYDQGGYDQDYGGGSNGYYEEPYQAPAPSMPKASKVSRPPVPSFGPPAPRGAPPAPAAAPPPVAAPPVAPPPVAAPPPAAAPKGVPPAAGGRGDLLSQIRQGAKLKKVETDDRSGAILGSEQRAAAAANKPSNPGGKGGGGGGSGGNLEAELAKSVAQFRKFMKPVEDDDRDEDAEWRFSTA